MIEEGREIGQQKQKRGLVGQIQVGGGKETKRWIRDYVGIQNLKRKTRDWIRDQRLEGVDISAEKKYRKEPEKKV